MTARSAPDVSPLTCGDPAPSWVSFLSSSLEAPFITSDSQPETSVSTLSVFSPQVNKSHLASKAFLCLLKNLRLGSRPCSLPSASYLYLPSPLGWWAGGLPLAPAHPFFFSLHPDGTCMHYITWALHLCSGSRKREEGGGRVFSPRPLLWGGPCGLVTFIKVLSS